MAPCPGEPTIPQVSKIWVHFRAQTPSPPPRLGNREMLADLFLRRESKCFWGVEGSDPASTSGWTWVVCAWKHIWFWTWMEKVPWSMLVSVNAKRLQSSLNTLRAEGTATPAFPQHRLYSRSSNPESPSLFQTQQLRIGTDNRLQRHPGSLHSETCTRIPQGKQWGWLSPAVCMEQKASNHNQHKPWVDGGLFQFQSSKNLWPRRDQKNLCQLLISHSFIDCSCRKPVSI